MSRFDLVAAASFLSAVALGCNDTTTKQPTTPAVAPTAVESGSEEASKIAKAMDKLPEADRQAAETQATCPVTGELLGSMGKPIKLIVGDKQLFLCCAGCEKKATEKFDEYYAQVTESTKSQQ